RTAYTPTFLPPRHGHTPPSFLFPDASSPAIYPLSLHDALPISARSRGTCRQAGAGQSQPRHRRRPERNAHLVHLVLVRGVVRRVDRKSTRLNSSHVSISYAVFCLKKKNNDQISDRRHHFLTPPR